MNSAFEHDTDGEKIIIKSMLKYKYSSKQKQRKGMIKMKKYFEVEFAKVMDGKGMTKEDVIAYIVANNDMPDGLEYFSDYSICIVGTREPSIGEAAKFCAEDLKNLGYDFVSNVLPISKEEAHSFFDMDEEDKFPVFE